MESLDGSLNLTQQVTHELGRAIVQGEYAIDAPFPTEADLSARYNISRSVTREAVKMLTAKGLISSRPRKGIRVLPAAYWNMFDTDVLSWTLHAKPSLELLKEFIQLRLAIEPEAAALASASASSEQLTALEKALERMHLAEHGVGDPLSAAIDFHCALLRASNNRFFVQLCSFIRAALRVGAACSHQLSAVNLAKAEECRRVFEHIRKGHSNKGRQAMRVLLDESMAALVASMPVQRVSEAQRKEQVGVE